MGEARPKTWVPQRLTAIGFRQLGTCVVRRPLLIVGLWLVAAVLLMLTLPSLKEVGEKNQPAALPSSAPSRLAAQAMAKAFGESGSSNLVLVVLTDDQGLNAGDEATYRRLVETLRADTHDVVSVQDFVTAPDMRSMLTSADNKAWIVPVGLAGDLDTPQAAAAYQRVVAAAKAALADVSSASLTVNFTGPAATSGELATLSEREVHVIGIVTAVIVLAVLALMFRNLVTIVLPLATIGVAVVVAHRVVAGFALLGMAVSNRTMLFMIAALLGIGTGYAVFLIGRYHEFLRADAPSDDAVREALATTGKMLAAWAAMLGSAFFVMGFTRLGVFSMVGPALAVTITVGFLVAVTLLPALLCLAGRRDWVVPRRDLTAQFWRRSAVYVVRRPLRYAVPSVLVLTVLAACIAFIRLDHDDRNMLPAAADSNRGYAAMDQHFPVNTAIPQYLLVQSSHDLRTTQSLADLELMAQRVSQVRDIGAVRGLTRPSGQPLEQAKVSYQAGAVGTQLSGAASHIANSGGQLNAMSQGSLVLADALASISTTVDESLGVVKALVDAAAELAQQFDAQKTLDLIDSALGFAKSLNMVGDMMGVSLADQQGFFDVVVPVVDGLNASPVCDFNASCAGTRAYLQRLVQARDDGAFDAFNDLGHTLQAIRGDGNIDAAVHNLQTFLRSASQAVKALGVQGSSAMRQQIDSWLVGARGLAQGSRQLAGQVQTLVDQTKQMGMGLDQAGTMLSMIKTDAAQSSMAGFYIPQQVLASPGFKNVAAVTVSQDGHAVRYLVQSTLNPASTAAMAQVDEILAAARSAQPNTSLSDATISLAGMAVANRDMRGYCDHDVRYLGIVTTVVVLAVLMLLLRAVVAPLYLVGATVLAALSALGVGVVVFQMLLHQPLLWTAPGTAFVVLLAAGANDSLLLLARVRDQSPYAVRSGVIRTALSAGETATCAGVIFAVSMFGLSFSSRTALAQVGFMVGVGVLLNTVLLRPVTVSAVAALVGSASWWPSGILDAIRRKRAWRQAVTAAVHRGELIRPQDIRPIFSRWSRATYL
ncbi:MAG: RND family transporter [Mycobacteriaceae bacterium]|nr:RND family transporter [Mycobacteriaceae bacterium]